MPTEEKQLTAINTLIDKLTIKKNKALAQMKKMGDADKSTEFADGMFTAYSDAITEALLLLATERQQLIDAYASDRTPCSEQDAIDYFETTFKTQ